MADCTICGKSGEDTLLFEGIVSGSIKPICKFCASSENITLVKKPTLEQLREAEKRQSVRQLMDKLSSPQSRIMAKDSMIAHKNLAKLNFPLMKQEHIDLVQNYDWVIKQARRHKKLSTSQVSELAGIDKAQLESLERGQVFADFEKVVQKIEKVLEIKVVKNQEQIAKVIRTPQERKSIEKEILSSVREKVSAQKKRGFFSFFSKEDKESLISPEEIDHDIIDVEELKQQKKEENEKRLLTIQNKMEAGEIDFSDKEKLSKIRLQDLAEIKKRKEKNSSI